MADSMVSMARTAKEKKANEEKYTSMPMDGPDYPYGLCLSLDDSELKKLGVDTLPEVGDELTINAVCKVTRVSASASEKSDKQRSVELQITHMDSLAPDEEPKKSAAKTLYPDND